MLDLSSGLYRSLDGGQNWTNFWPDMKFRNKDFYNTGYIAADVKNPATLYLSALGDKGSVLGSRFKVFRLTNADQKIFDSLDDSDIADISLANGRQKIKRPGPLTVGLDGKLWLTQQQDSKNKIHAKLFVMNRPGSDRSFVDVTTEEYRKTATSPSGIAVSADGFIYVSQSGAGLVKLTPR